MQINVSSLFPHNETIYPKELRMVKVSKTENFLSETLQKITVLKKAPDQMFIIGKLLIYLARDLGLINPRPFSASSNFALNSSSTDFSKSCMNYENLNIDIH